MPTAIVLATAGKKADIEMFLYTDKAVKKNFYSNSAISPWSPYTGRLGVRSDMKKKVLSSELVKTKVTKLCKCNTCHSSISINKFAASERSLQKHLFCPVCAADLHSQIPSGEDDMTMMPESEEDALSTGDIDEEGEITEEPDNDMRRASTMGEDDESSQGDMLDVTKRSSYVPMASKKKKLKNKEKMEKNIKKSSKERNKKRKNKKEVPVRDDVGTLENKKPAVIDQPRDQAFQDITGEPVAASVKKDRIVFNFDTFKLTNANLTVVPVTAVKSYLFANEKPIMILRANKASDEIKPLFGTPVKLLEAIATTVSNNSFEPKAFGAKSIKVKVSLPKTLAAQQNKANEAIAAKYKSKAEKLEQDYFDALCVAAVAVTKNTVEKNPNTLKRAIVKTMASQGVRNPEKLVDAAFAAEGENLMRNIVAYARDFMGKSRTAQKEISKFVASASYNSSKYSEADDVAEHLGDGSMVAASVSMNNISDDETEETVVPTSRASVVATDVEFFTNLLRNKA